MSRRKAAAPIARLRTLARSIEALGASDALLDSPRRVHDARALAKRAEETLRLLASGPEGRRRRRRALKRVRAFRRDLARLRDADVGAALARELAARESPAARAELRRWARRLRRRRERERAALDGRVRSAAALARSLGRAARASRGAELPALRAETADLLGRRARSLDESARRFATDAGATALHAARRRVRRARFTLEAARPIAGARARALERALHDLQRGFGAVRDLDLLLALRRRERRARDPVAACLRRRRRKALEELGALLGAFPLRAVARDLGALGRSLAAGRRA